MNGYDSMVEKELDVWQRKMLRGPSLLNKFSKRIQTKINTWIPVKIHQAITLAVKQMIRGVLFGARLTSTAPLPALDLMSLEIMVKRKIQNYKKTAAVEGGITGAGGLLLGLVDFPVLIGIKIKLLFEIASLYGCDTGDYKERVYLLHIFELAFSGDVHRRNVYLSMVHWDKKSKDLPDDIHQFDWRNLQQEYRDYLDLAKMAQLIPVIGAPVGVIVNSRLISKLGITAMNAYRMRRLQP